MRKVRLVVIGFCGSFLGTISALGADLPVKAPVQISYYNWTGPYAGINGGGGWGTSDSSAPFVSGSFNTSGGLIGGTLGYNWQWSHTVFGIEGDIDWSNIRGSTSCGSGTSCETRTDWLGTLRGRLGWADFAWDRTMIYITGGLTGGNIKHSVAGSGSISTTKAGWTLGAGVEGALLWSRLTAKIEYLYADLGRGGSVAGSDAKFNANIVRIGLNYRF